MHARAQLTSRQMVSCRYSRRQRKLLTLGCVMVSVVIGLIAFATAVIYIAEIPDTIHAASLTLDAQSLPECSWQEWRLPQNITPRAYDLTLQVCVQACHAAHCTLIHAAVDAVCLVC